MKAIALAIVVVGLHAVYWWCKSHDLMTSEIQTSMAALEFIMLVWFVLAAWNMY